MQRPRSSVIVSRALSQVQTKGMWLDCLSQLSATGKGDNVCEGWGDLAWDAAGRRTAAVCHTWQWQSCSFRLAPRVRRAAAVLLYELTAVTNYGNKRQSLWLHQHKSNATLWTAAAASPAGLSNMIQPWACMSGADNAWTAIVAGSTEAASAQIKRAHSG